MGRLERPNARTPVSEASRVLYHQLIAENRELRQTAVDLALQKAILLERLERHSCRVDVDYFR